jgi:hypothetical protein
MNMTYARPLPTKERTSIHLFLITIICTVLLFFVDSANAQIADSYRLIGVIRSTNFTGIVLSDSKGIQSFYRVSDKLPDGSQIVEVRSDSISLKGSDGTSYDMYISSYMSDIHGTKTSVSVRPDVPADPYALGATRSATPEQQVSQVPHRGRRGRTQSSNDD